jgi:hypothetical protein
MMPQVRRGSRGAGLHMPGVYAALFAYARARYESRGGEPLVIEGIEIGKKQPAGVDEHGKEGFFLYPRRGLLNALEAGKTVDVGRGWVEIALWERDRPPNRVRLPFDREVRRVSVSPDDRIVPAAAECVGGDTSVDVGSIN